MQLLINHSALERELGQETLDHDLQ